MKKLLLPLALLLPGAVAAQTVDPARLSADVKVLASDAFGGRAPGSAGEKTTVDWLVQRFRSLGLEGAAADGGFVQRVPLVHTRVQEGATFRIGGTSLAQGKEIAVTTVGPAERITIANAPLVFVGYGVSAPEA